MCIHRQICVCVCELCVCVGPRMGKAGPETLCRITKKSPKEAKVRAKQCMFARPQSWNPKFGGFGVFRYVLGPKSVSFYHKHV